MGPAAVDTLNADRSGLHETKTIQRDRKGHPCPRTRPSGRAKETDLARALIISALPGILSHSSQDRNASPRKAGGAVNIKQSKEQQRKTGRPGPGVRDFGQIAFARYWIRASGGFQAWNAVRDRQSRNSDHITTIGLPGWPGNPVFSHRHSPVANIETNSSSGGFLSMECGQKLAEPQI